MHMLMLLGTLLLAPGIQAASQQPGAPAVVVPPASALPVPAIQAAYQQPAALALVAPAASVRPAAAVPLSSSVRPALAMPLPASVLPAAPASLPAYQLALPQQGPFEYSDAYAVRLKIHKIASFVTLPLFVLQYISGQQKLNGGGGDFSGEDDGEGGGGLAEWHGLLAGSIAGLFAVNTITGGWNLIEARKDPENRAWRTIHGVLMLAADAGFVATGVTASEGGDNSANVHRTLAISSMGVALVSYLMMLPPFRKD